MLAHHPYDYVLGFGIALVGMLLIFWAERRARSRQRSRKVGGSDTPTNISGDV